MRRLILAACFALPLPAAADECDVVAARAVATIGVAVDEREGDEIYLKHPDATGVIIDCARPEVLIYNSASPGKNAEFVSPKFFVLFARLASHMGLESEAVALAAAKSCHEDMLRSGSIGHVVQLRLRLICDRKPVEGLPKFLLSLRP